MKLNIQLTEKYSYEVQDLTMFATGDDKKYAIAMGYENITQALLDISRQSALLYSVRLGGLCVALVGVLEDVEVARVWTHTSNFIRGQKALIMPALEDIMGRIVDADPAKQLYATFLKQDDIIKLAAMAGFKHHQIEHDINGLTHITAWRQ